MPLRFPAGCHLCHAQGRLDHDAPVMLDVRDTGPYEFECPNHHKTRLAMQAMHFQVLFEVGIAAIVDGYPREAVADFAASLERYQEAFARAAAIALDLPIAEFETVWKAVAVQSERQTGLYAGLHLTLLRSAPPTLAKKMVELRNEVIHKGKIPDQGTAIGFGQHVADLITTGIDALWRTCPDAVHTLIVTHIASQSPSTQRPDGMWISSTMAYPMTIELMENRHGPVDIELAVQARRNSVSRKW